MTPLSNNISLVNPSIYMASTTTHKAQGTEPHTKIFADHNIFIVKEIVVLS